jgi:hypothetical protein
MKKGGAFPFAFLAIAASLSLGACFARSTAIKGAARENGAVESADEAKGLDPRAAFESSGLVGGISASLESAERLIVASGTPEAGVSLALGGALPTAAIARRIAAPAAAAGYSHELVLVSGAHAELPGPILAITSVGERIVVACALRAGLGSLACFISDGEKLIEAWKTEGSPVRRLLAVPGGRLAVADEAGGLRLIDASSGSKAWERDLPNAVEADIAYAPGIILCAAGLSLDAYEESSGTTLWSAALTAKARSVSAGNDVVFVLAENGGFSSFSLVDGIGIGAAPGPFDSACKPLADGIHAILALIGGGAVEIDAKSGDTLRSWAWEGMSSFLTADRDRVYAGIDGREGRGILVASRAGDPSRRLVKLESPAFDAPQAITGANGGLLVLLMDGSLVLVGKTKEASRASSELDSAIAPSRETAEAIAASIGRFKLGDSIEPRRYLRFDLFAQGIPVDTGVAFTAFRFESQESAKRSFAASPERAGSVIAIYDETGREIAASIDELRSSHSATAYFEKGKLYWIIAGWSYQSDPESFRLYLR